MEPMHMKDYEVAKQTADNLEYLLVALKDRPDELAKSTLRVLEGFRHAYALGEMVKAERKIDQMSRKLKKDPKLAAPIMFTLIREVRETSLDELYRNIVKPEIRKKAES